MHFHTFLEQPGSPLIFTAEHASYEIPAEYGDLGLTAHQKQNCKDLFDPGSLELARGLAEKFNGNLIYPNFSRLLIDANRRLDAVSNKNNGFHAAALKTQLLVEDENGETIIQIPGNQENQETEELHRWNTYVLPYWQEIEALSQRLLTEFPKITIIQIHSFYPAYNRNVRTIDIDVIHSGTELGKNQIEFLRKNSTLTIGDNEPWSMQAVDGGILKPLQNNPRIELLAYDINNKHLRDQEGIAEIISLLSRSLEKSLS